MRKRYLIALVATSLSVLGAVSLAIGPESPNFGLPSSVTGGGGGAASSSHYALGATAGQPGGIGAASNGTTYALGAGFWYGNAPPVAADADGDGFTSAAEASITTDANNPCGSGGWPADLQANNKLDIGDLNSFLFPLRDLNGNTIPGEPGPPPGGDDDGSGVFNKFNHPVPDTNDAGIARWNLQVNAEIDIGDLNALNPAVTAPTSRPPMFGGQPAFFTDVGNGIGGCPFPP